MRCRFLFVASVGDKRAKAAGMRFVLPVLAMTTWAACSRSPAEDFPPHPAATAAVATVTVPAASTGEPPVVPVAVTPATPEASATSASTAGRCIVPTPDAPPRAVAPGPAPGCPVDPEGPQKVPVARVTFPDAAGASVQAEIVSKSHDTTRGLMYRRSMPDDHGMLFHLAERMDQQFWMHNTCIPLDLVYVDTDGLVVGIVENAPTLDDSPRGVGCPSLYVLEVNAGWTRKHGVKAGQHMTIPPGA
jgi:hypothetical protein